MKNKKTEGVILIICGLICIAAGLFVYFTAHTIYPHSESSRVQDLNWLLKTFGKAGTALLFSAPGVIAIYAGVKRLTGSKN